MCDAHQRTLNIQPLQAKESFMDLVTGLIYFIHCKTMKLCKCINGIAIFHIYVKYLSLAILANKIFLNVISMK